MFTDLYGKNLAESARIDAIIDGATDFGTSLFKVINEKFVSFMSKFCNTLLSFSLAFW